jgi:hypothetical protein
MALRLSLLTCLMILAAASQADALQVTNRDTEDHKISVTEKSGTQELTVKASQVLDGICTGGCTIKTQDGEEYEFDGNEVVSIEEGLMFLDEPSDAGAPDTGEPAAAPPDAATEKKNP